LQSARRIVSSAEIASAGFAAGAVYPVNNVIFPIFVAWALKSIILRIGGVQGYRAGRPFFIGLIMGFVQDGVLFGPRARLFLTVGLLGSLTTFSTFGYETLELIREHDAIRAAANAAANLLLGLGAVLCGRALARWWLG